MDVSGNGYDLLNQAIEEASTEYRSMETKAEMVAYYQETYGKGWRVQIQRAISNLTGTKYNSVRRQFDPSRLNNAPVKGSENEKAFKELGQQLPPMQVPKDLKGKQAIVSLNGAMLIESGRKSRTSKADIRGQKLDSKHTNEMKRGNMESIFDAWGIGYGVISGVEVYSVSVDFV